MNLIMFDMDGTLFRTETSFFPSVREFASRHAFPAPDEEFLRGFIGQNGTEWRAWLSQLNLDKSVPELAAEFDLIEQDYVRNQGELYPSAVEVLRALASDGWKLGICSNAPAWYPEAILTRAAVRELFTLIRVPSRPDQTKTMMLCDVWNELHPEHCAMVGDRADDMQAAYAGGYFAIGAVYGWAPEELERADVRVHDIADVPAALAARWPQAEDTARQPAAEAVPTAASQAVPHPAPQPAPPVTTTPAKPAEPTRPASVAETPHTPEPAAPPPAAPPAAATQPPQSIAQPSAPPVQPVAQPSAPTPDREQPATPAPHIAPPLAPTPAPAPAPAERRSWNPFRRRDDKSR